MHHNLMSVAVHTYTCSLCSLGRMQHYWGLYIIMIIHDYPALHTCSLCSLRRSAILERLLTFRLKVPSSPSSGPASTGTTHELWLRWVCYTYITLHYKHHFTPGLCLVQAIAIGRKSDHDHLHLQPGCSSPVPLNQGQGRCTSGDLSINGLSLFIEMNEWMRSGKQDQWQLVPSSWL